MFSRDVRCVKLAKCIGQLFVCCVPHHSGILAWKMLVQGSPSMGVPVTSGDTEVSSDF